VNPRYEEIELTDSAYRHGYDEDDVAEMLLGGLGAPLFIRSRRGLDGYEILGRNAAGAYLLAACRVVESRGGDVCACSI